MSGYIKFHRATLEHALLAYDNAAYIVFTKILLRVDRATGNYTTGRFKLAELCNLPPMTTWDALKRLEKAEMVVIKSDNKKSVIAICNWAKWQDEPSPSPSTTRHQTVTKQEVRSKNNTNAVLEITNTITGRSFRVLPRTAATTLKEFSLSEITLALTNLSKDKWHREKLKELSLDYLLRPTTIDKFLTLKTNVPSRGYA